MHGSRVEHQRLALPLLASDVRVAVTDHVPAVASGRFSQQTSVVAVQEGNLQGFQLYCAEKLMARLPRRLDRSRSGPRS